MRYCWPRKLCLCALEGGSHQEDGRKTWTFAVSPGSGFPSEGLTLGRTLGEGVGRAQLITRVCVGPRQYLGHCTAVMGIRNVSCADDTFDSVHDTSNGP